MNTKRCSRCEETKPCHEFHRNGTRLAGYCKDCARDYHRTWYQKQRGKPRQPRRVNVFCPRCQTTLAHEDFYWRGSGVRSAYCKPCMNAHAAAWRKANPEKQRAISARRWQKVRREALQRILEGRQS